LKVAIISHTEHYADSDGIIVGWGPTIKEINELSEHVESLIHIAPLHLGKFPQSSMQYSNTNIKFIPIKPSGGKGIRKISIISAAYSNIRIIKKVLKEVDIVQFRAPTGIGIYILPCLKFFNHKKYWVKYAGNWKDENMPLGNKFQKWWLQNCTSSDTKITINGVWEGERKNITAFENPCIDESERLLGKLIVQKKRLTLETVFCFVGALNEHKGVSKIIKVLKKLNKTDSKRTKTFHFVGDGPLRVDYEEMAKECDVNCVFHGFLQKEEIQKIYSESHFIVLPSKSEGFPKVIGEAMNFGCIPIVSDVSCVGQYIIDNKNGFLLENLENETILHKLGLAIHLNQENYLKWIQNNFELAEKFTYSHYNNRIINEIFN
jgi:glycosyltransferase involved in cell wall biosynthesis